MCARATQLNYRCSPDDIAQCVEVVRERDPPLDAQGGFRGQRGTMVYADWEGASLCLLKDSSLLFQKVHLPNFGVVADRRLHISLTRSSHSDCTAV